MHRFKKNEYTKNSDLLIYEESNDIKVEVILQNENIWMTQEQISKLYGKSKSTINEHIKNIYEENELLESNTMRKFGNSEFSTKPTNFYNLDLIIAVGFRVKLSNGTKFRIWANEKLKEYLVKGYNINMIIIFGTTNERKTVDLRNIIKKLGLDIEVKSLTDISWDRGEILETGNTLEENSIIKAKAIYDFCKDNNINYPILTDDAGLFVESLNGEPGIYTGRYAEEELKQKPLLLKYECVNKLLRKLNGISNRNAYYKCVVTYMYEDGTYFQDFGISDGTITENIVEPIKKPYFYSVFRLIDSDKTFNLLSEEELNDTYRYKTLDKVLTKVYKRKRIN